MTIIEEGMREARALGYQEAVEHIKINLKYNLDPLDGLDERLEKMREKPDEE